MAMSTRSKRAITGFYARVREHEETSPAKHAPGSITWNHLADEVKSKILNACPVGVIVMWSGFISDIPPGWQLCDGTNGTPDLRDKFIKGIPNSSTNPGATGGRRRHSHTVNSHTHTIGAVGDHQHTLPTASSYRGTSGSITVLTGTTTGLAGAHTHGGGATGETAPPTDEQDHLPPYYELAFIMKIA
jgi:hypothetical protein